MFFLKANPRALNLFTQLFESAALFKFYLELQNSDCSKTNLRSSEISLLIFCKKFRIFGWITRELLQKHYSLMIQLNTADLPDLFIL
jgi:hypothetical protein